MIFWEILTGFDPAVLTAFVIAGLLLNITPGVDFVFISASGIQGGPRIGIAAGVGICLGVAVHIVAASAGLSALLLAYPAAYQIIKYLGAVYLLWLAIQAWRSDGAIGAGSAAMSIGSAVKRGFLTNILNPKTALFIFAFIPQFTNPEIGPIWAQILLLGLIFLGNGLVFALALGAAAGLFANFLRTKVGALNKLTAILFGGLAARIVFD